MAVIPLKSSRRESLGKGGARKARAAGQIPAVLYGHGETPVAVAIGAREFELALRGHKGGNPLVNLDVAGSEYTALIRDVQYDPITHDILHLDFQHISLTEKVEVDVAIHLTGLAIGVKDGGGILEQIVRTLKVRCLPTAIPGSVDLDVSALNVGESLHVSDLKVKDVEILSDPTATVATVVAPTVMEEKPAEEAAVAAAPTEPEVIAKGKKDEEGEPAKDTKDAKEPAAAKDKEKKEKK